MPVSAKAKSAKTTAPVNDAPVRAEFPPPQYWRKWCEDAASAVLPGDDSASGAVSDIPALARQTAVGDGSEPPYRILVVEDDRSQALFAESVLGGAGMQVHGVLIASEMMEAMEAFQPDLVLMDLHMPGMSGTELTGLIRAHGAYAHTPVVFLTGDQDPDRQVEVLESGADDYISKPVRPRHLIAAVLSRVKRARALQGQQRPSEGVHPTTGLLTRTSMLQRLGAAIPGESKGALYFIEIENTTALRDRFGYAALEGVLTEAGRQIAAIATDAPAARLNDNTFLLHASHLTSDDLQAWARTLRDGLGRHPFSIRDETLRLRGLVGYASLEHPFGDASSALAAAEQALRQARTLPIGIAAYQPPVAADDARLNAFADELKSALIEERFELAFQPIVAVAGGDEAQYQTLLRMRDGNGELHNAAQIIPAAESAGLMCEIDRRVLQHAIEVLRRRRIENNPVRLFVSQSPRSLTRDGHAAWLLELMIANEVEGASLVIDVRQNDALVHAVALHEFCMAMVPAGVQLCLSQFQSSDESDALLAQLPLGFVRLSARYATRLDDTGVRDEMRAAIERAHRLGLQVIGQQVEDPQAAATLWMSGVDYIQGNLVQGAAGALDFDFQHSVL
ncbi:MAG: EAL domain-containing protein [Luteimonas sp.]